MQKERGRGRRKHSVRGKNLGGGMGEELWEWGPRDGATIEM